MERLEAALEKAREQRQTVKPAESVAVLTNPIKNPIKREPADPWKLLGDIKLSARVARNNRITTLTNNALSGSYDMLRSRTIRIMKENKWSRLAITSPNTACGKTTVTANLAISMARQSDLRILVFDMDMRRPALNKIFAHKDRQSLHEVLNGNVEPREQLLRFGDNLAFAFNYKPAMKPAELLQSNRTTARLAEIQDEFLPDLMIFDMPPMLGNDDNVGFLKNVDCALLVGAAEETSVPQLDVCEKELAELTNVLGVVLNKCRYMDAGAGYENEYY